MDRLPPELFTQIMDTLPPVYIYRLRAVSRAWNVTLSTQSMVRRTVKRAGLDVEDLEVQEQIMKNHIIFRPAKQFTWDFDLDWDSGFQFDTAFCGDLFMCTDISHRREELQIVVLDLKKKLQISKTINVDRHDDRCTHLSDRIVVVVLKRGDKVELQWMTTGLERLTKVDAPEGLILESVDVCGFLVAGFVQRGDEKAVWMYDALTNRHHYLDVACNNEQLDIPALSLEAGTVTLWYIQDGLNVRRYDLTGVLQSWKKYFIECDEHIRIRSASEDQYVLSAWKDMGNELFLVDLSAGYVEANPLSDEFAVCWRGR